MKFLLFLFIAINAAAQTGTQILGPATLGQPEYPNSGSTKSRASVQGETPSSLGQGSPNNQAAGTVPIDKSSQKEIKIELGPYDRDGNYRYFNKK